MTGLADRLRALIAAGEPSALVTVVAARGSTPREAGARMLVWPTGTDGTIGGGRLEFEAITAARRLLGGAANAGGDARATAASVTVGRASVSAGGGGAANAGRDARATAAVTVGRASAPAGAGGAASAGGDARATEADGLAVGRTSVPAATVEIDIPLGPAIGQCCGGHVTLRIECADAGTSARLGALERNERAAMPQVLLFGAGHVGKAIAAALSPLPLALSWIDSRADEFPDLLPGATERIVVSDPAAEVAKAPAGCSFLILTHSHALDFAIAEAVLWRGDFRYCGLIGSATKRVRFERWYRARGGRAATLARLVCPIGAGLDRDKRPAVIAAMVAAELLVALNTATLPVNQRGGARRLTVTACETCVEDDCFTGLAGAVSAPAA